MKITKLEVANYRGLSTKVDEEVRPIRSFSFDEQFNVIVGVNGIGKSSVLDIIALLLSRILPLTTPARNSKQRFLFSDVRSESRSLTARIWLDFKNKKLSYSIADAFEPKRKVVEDLDTEAIKMISETYQSRNIDSMAGAPLAIYYSVDRAMYRLSRKVKEPPSGRAAAYLNALVKKGVNFPFMVSWLQTRQMLAEEDDAKSARLLRVIDQALTRFLPAFGHLEATTNPPRLFIKKDGVRLEIAQLSHGERSFIAMVTDIAVRLALANPESDDPLSGGNGIVLIDELDLHLHPKWQRNMVEYLKKTFKKVQFITTTHSPFIIQALKPGQLINLDPDEIPDEYADKSIEDIAETVMGIEMPQKSERYQEMMKVAEEYFRILRDEKPATAEEKEQLKNKLDELSEPFSDDPAYIALLKLERETQLGEE